MLSVLPKYERSSTMSGSCKYNCLRARYVVSLSVHLKADWGFYCTFGRMDIISRAFFFIFRLLFFEHQNNVRKTKFVRNIMFLKNVKDRDYDLHVIHEVCIYLSFFVI